MGEVAGEGVGNTWLPRRGALVVVWSGGGVLQTENKIFYFTKKKQKRKRTMICSGPFSYESRRVSYLELRSWFLDSHISSSEVNFCSCFFTKLQGHYKDNSFPKSLQIVCKNNPFT